MKLYTKAGYLNVEGLLRQSFCFNFLIGGRGTGKTFGALQHIRNNNLKVFFIRRQQTQIDIISKPEFNPFKAVDKEITVETASKYHSVFIRNDKVIGYAAALSTFAKIRGFDASDVDIMFYDEFIPELHERPIKNEAAALFNAYETVNRNRELSGKPPVILLCAANSNRLDNPVLQGFNLLPDLEKLIRTGKELFTDRSRSILLAYLQHSPISDEKENTALYRALKGNNFSEMSIKNRFGFSADRIRSKDLTQFKIMARIGNIGVYVSRQGGASFYVRQTKETAKYQYKDNEDGIKQFRRDFPMLPIWDIKGMIEFESLDVYTRFRQIFA